MGEFMLFKYNSFKSNYSNICLDIKLNKSELKSILATHPRIEWLDDNQTVFYFRGAYCLSRGEHNRPYYRLTKYEDGWGIKINYSYQFRALGRMKNQRISEDELDDILDACIIPEKRSRSCCFNFRGFR